MLGLVLTVGVAVLPVRPVVSTLSSRRRTDAGLDPLRSSPRTGPFGSVSRVRQEVVVEGTADPAAVRGDPCTPDGAPDDC